MIDNLEFEWDEGKAKTNLAMHGVSFFVAVATFRRERIEIIDDREDRGEERWVSLGRLGTEIYRVTFTWRGESLVRIISTRRANENERQTYYGQIHP